MSLPAPLQEVSVSKFVTTPQGLEVLENSPNLRDAVVDYCQSISDRPQDCLRSGSFVGEGGNSQVWGIDGVAVKASSGTTGRNHWEYGLSSNENLMIQFNFLRAIGERLDRRTGGEIRTPDQYFAIKTTGGDYLLAQELMEKWETLPKWAINHEHEFGSLFATSKARIGQALGKSGLLFRSALDLRIHAQNIMLPKADTSPDRLCVIDQPSSGLASKVGSLAITLGGHTLPKAA